MAAAHPAWAWFAVADGTPRVRLWRHAAVGNGLVATPSSALSTSLPLPCPGWFLDLAEALARRRFTLDGAEEAVESKAFFAVKARVAAAPAGDPWTRWGQWFFADRSQRALAWDSLRSSLSAADQLLAGGRFEDLRQASRLSPTNALVLARLALATLAQTNSPSRVLEADFLSRRAVDLAPQSAEVQRLREELERRLASPAKPPD
jgi:hypothetical protein